LETVRLDREPAAQVLERWFLEVIAMSKDPEEPRSRDAALDRLVEEGWPGCQHPQEWGRRRA
jgi:hypothetical protein